MTLDINRAWDNEFDSYPILLTQLDNIIDTIYKLDKVAPGTANCDTLLYGVECKYYSSRPAIDEGFKIKGTNNIFAIGDGAGFTRSLSQAGAHGLYVADFINK